MEVLMSIRCVLRTFVCIEALFHVVEDINAFLDISLWCSLSRAATTGSVGLLKRVLTRRNNQNLEPGVLTHWWGQAMKKAVQKGDLTSVQLIHTVHPEPFGVDVFEVATEHGHFELLQWLLSNRWDGLCCSKPPSQCVKGTAECCLYYASSSALGRGHFQMVKFMVDKKMLRIRQYWSLCRKIWRVGYSPEVLPGHTVKPVQMARVQGVRPRRSSSHPSLPPRAHGD